MCIAAIIKSMLVQFTENPEWKYCKRVFEATPAYKERQEHTFALKLQKQ